MTGERFGPRRLALAERAEGGSVRILAPSVGWWSGQPRPGATLAEGDPIGTLQHLNHRFVLVLPRDAHGVVHGSLSPDRRLPVEYREVLFELRPRAAGADGSAAQAAPTAERDPDRGSWSIVAPTDGVFYRRPAPDAPPLVIVGSRVRAGQAIGLIEAMKTFNQIVYGGPDFPEEGEVVEILCADGSEVRSGQILVRIR
jgi:biotin carboxyl carrier protein